MFQPRTPTTYSLVQPTAPVNMRPERRLPPVSNTIASITTTAHSDLSLATQCVVPRLAKRTVPTTSDEDSDDGIEIVAEFPAKRPRRTPEPAGQLAHAHGQLGRRSSHVSARPSDGSRPSLVDLMEEEEDTPLRELSAPPPAHAVQRQLYTSGTGRGSRVLSSDVRYRIARE